MTHVNTIRESVILNGCEGSHNHAEQRYFALLSMTVTAGSTSILLLIKKADFEVKSDQPKILMGFKINLFKLIFNELCSWKMQIKR